MFAFDIFIIHAHHIFLGHGLVHLDQVGDFIGVTCESLEGGQLGYFAGYTLQSVDLLRFNPPFKF